MRKGLANYISPAYDTPSIIFGCSSGTMNTQSMRSRQFTATVLSIGLMYTSTRQLRTRLATGLDVLGSFLVGINTDFPCRKLMVESKIKSLSAPEWMQHANIWPHRPAMMTMCFSFSFAFAWEVGVDGGLGYGVLCTCTNAATLVAFPSFFFVLFSLYFESYFFLSSPDVCLQSFRKWNSSPSSLKQGENVFESFLISFGFSLFGDDELQSMECMVAPDSDNSDEILRPFGLPRDVR